MNIWKKALKFVKKVWHSFSNYSEESSIHSLNYIGKKNLHWIERIFWILAFSFSLSSCSYLIAKTYEKWDNDPVLVTFNERYTPNWKIPFPAVTICPESKTDIDKFNLTEVKNLVSNRKRLTTNQKKGFEALGQVCDSFGFPVITRKPNIIQQLRDISNDFAHLSTSDMGELDKNFLENDFSEIITDEGVCYTYNMLEQKDFYKKQINPMLLMKNNQERSNWTIFGYEVENDADAYPKRILASGIKSGLSLHLKMRKKDIDYICKGHNGFRLTLHTPDEMPQPASNFFRIPFDVETLISVKPRVTSTSENLRPYTPEKRQCYFPGEKELKFFKAYSQANCKLECHSEFILKRCKCVKFSMPHVKGTKICGTQFCSEIAERLERVHKFYADVTSKFEEVQDYSDFERMIYSLSNYTNISLSTSTDANDIEMNNENENSGTEKYEDCKCLPACSSIKYDAEITQTNVNIKEYFKAGKLSQEFYHAFATIYFKEDHFIETRRTELYGWLNFLSSCGGFLGLLMGGSFLSLIEIVYHMTFKKFFIRRRTNDVKNEMKTI